jgi:ABC-type glycerol-3-phosphate transport system substrate-binding protein
MKRRKFIVFLFCIVAVLIITACTKKEASGSAQVRSEEKKTIRIMRWGSTENALNYMKYFSERYPEFMEKCNVEYFVGGSGDDVCAEQMRLALASGESICDINQLNYTQLAEFARAGVLLSVEDIIAPVRDDMLTGFRMMTEYDGKALAVPNSIKAKLWFYRKDIFDQASIDPTKIKNAEDFIAAGKKLKSINPKYRMWSLGAPNAGYQYMMVLSGTDTSFADQNGKFRLTADPNFKRILEIYKRFLDEGIVADIPEWTPDWEKAFADEVLVSYLNATWLAQNMFLPKYAPEQKGKWEVTQWPSFIGEIGGSEAGGDISVIPEYSKEPELAKEFLKLQYLDKDGWFLHKNVGLAVVPMMKSWIDDPRAREAHVYLGGDFAGECIKSVESFKLFPWDPSAQLGLSILTPFFDSAITGKTPIDAALRDAQAALENQVGNPWER